MLHPTAVVSVVLDQLREGSFCVGVNPAIVAPVFGQLTLHSGDRLRRGEGFQTIRIIIFDVVQSK